MNLIRCTQRLLSLLWFSGKTGSRYRKHSFSRDSEILEDRALLAADFGDAPDTSVRTARADYQTLLANGGPVHTIDQTRVTLFLGNGVDAETGKYQNPQSTMDDWSVESDRAFAASDEDGVIGHQELGATVGSRPVVRVRVTNLTDSEAMLSGWLDANRNGVFDNLTERVQAKVAAGTNRGEAVLVFPQLPTGSAGTTYLRLRLSTDTRSWSSTGPAGDGEVEDHRFVITNRINRPVTFLRSVTVGDRINGGPDIGYMDFFGWDSTAIGDLNRDGVADLVVTAPADGGLEVLKGAAYVLFLNSTGSVKSSVKIGDRLNGGPVLSRGDTFGECVTCLGDIDGDGYSDIAIGASGDDTGGMDRGAIYVIHLTRTGTAKRVTKIASSLNGGPVLPNNATMGAVEAIGDLNGDGITDLIAGAPGHRVANVPAEGKLFLLLMNSVGTVRSATAIAFSLPWQYRNTPLIGFGQELASLGDLQRDGTIEIVVMSDEEQNGEVRSQYLDVLSINRDGVVTRHVRNTIPEITGQNDYSVGHLSAIGDQNGDGIVDLGYITEQPAALSGGFRFATVTAEGKIEQMPARSNLGLSDSLGRGLSLGGSISSPGDINNDGTSEFVLGVPAFVIDDRNQRFTGGLSVISFRADVPNTRVPAIPISSKWSSDSDPARTVFSWGYSDWARSYEVMLKNETTGTTLAEAVMTDVTRWSPGVPAVLGRYGFRIRARNEIGVSGWSATQFVTISTRVEAKAFSAEDHFGQRPVLSWKRLEGADRYELRIFSEKNGAIVHSAVVRSGDSYTPTVDLRQGEYRFEVRGVAKDGTLGQWSYSPKFRTEVAVVPEVVGAPVAIQPTVFVSPRADASGYEVEISQQPGGSVLIRETSSQSVIAVQSPLPVGSYTVRVRAVGMSGRPGKWSDWVHFEVAPAPSFATFPEEVNGSVNRSVLLTWTTTPGSNGQDLRFQLPVIDPAVPPAEIIHSPVAGNFYQENTTPNRSLLTQQGRYVISVRALYWGNRDRAFQGYWSEPVTITVRYEPKGVTADPQTSEIQWEGIPGASQYQVQITETVNGEERQVMDEVVTSPRLKPERPFPLGDYRIRVRGISPDGTRGYWSSVTTLASRPRPMLINAESRWMGKSVIIEWEPMEKAISYDVRVKPVFGWYSGQELRFNDVRDPQLQLSELGQGNYEWQVSPNLADGPTDVWSLPGTLITQSAAEFESISTASPSAFLTWSRIADAQSYELKIVDGYGKSVYLATDLKVNHLTVSLSKYYRYRAWVRTVGSDGFTTPWYFRDFVL